MNKTIKYLLSIISKIFSFSIFSFIYLLLFLQFGTLNLKLLDPIIKSNFYDKYLTRIDFVNNDINLKFDKNNNDLIFTVNSRLKNKPNVIEWSLFLDSEIKIKVSKANSFSPKIQTELKKQQVEVSKPEGNEVASPIIGTAYLAPEPGGKKFTEVGKKIKKGDTVMIVEAMKTMNHVPSSADGVVKEICVQDGQPVEFGQTIIILE